MSEYRWVTVGAKMKDGRLVFYKEWDGLSSDFSAFNAPLGEVTYPDVYVRRLQDALEGELDGLSVDEDTAHAILRYVLFEDVGQECDQ